MQFDFRDLARTSRNAMPLRSSPNNAAVKLKAYRAAFAQSRAVPMQKSTEERKLILAPSPFAS